MRACKLAGGTGMQGRAVRGLIGVLAAVLGLGGCQSGYRNFADAYAASFTSGDYQGASGLAGAQAERKAGDKVNRVVYNLEAARAAQLAGDLAASRVYFSRVHEDVRPYLDSQAEAKITEAGATTLVNQTTATYRATPVERVMATALNAVNCMGMGDLDAARVELNLTRDWQEDAVRRFGSEIESATASLESDAAGRGVPVKEEGVMAAVAPYYEGLADMRAYADFGNPFASHLRGVFLLATAADGVDLERARFDLRQVVAMEPGVEPVVTPDLSLIESRSRLEPTVWVYFLTGRAPSLEEIRLDIPIPFGNVNYVSAAFPRLVFHGDFVSGMTVESGGGLVEAVALADVDAMVAVEFNKRLPKIVMQEVVSSALKVGATYAAREEGGGWAQLAGIVYQALTTAADLRNWTGMPKRVLVARVPTPSDGRVTARAGAVDASFTVTAGESHIVVVSLPSSASRAASVITAGLDVQQAGGVAREEEVHDEP